MLMRKSWRKEFSEPGAISEPEGTRSWNRFMKITEAGRRAVMLKTSGSTRRRWPVPDESFDVVDSVLFSAVSRRLESPGTNFCQSWTTSSRSCLTSCALLSTRSNLKVDFWTALVGPTSEGWCSLPCPFRADNGRYFHRILVLDLAFAMRLNP